MVMKKPIILRSTFTGEKKPQLVIFVENVVTKMLGNKVYQELQDAVIEVVALLTTFKLALVASEDASTSIRKQRDSAYEALIFKLHILSSGIEFYSNGDINYIEGTGMTAQVAGKAKKSAAKALVAPLITKIEASKIPGYVDLDYTAIEGTKMYGFEYSEDQTTWKNGQYSHLTTGSVMIPTRKDVWVRVRAIGVNNVQSEFSAAAQIFIA
jgi:hypothetical protein